MSGSKYVPILHEEKSLFVSVESLLYAKLLHRSSYALVFKIKHLNKCGMV